jgi:Ca-activated chloride channel family protein
MIHFVWPWLFALAPLPILVRLWLPPAQQPLTALTVPSLSRFRAAASTATTPARRRPGGTMLLLWLAWLALVTAAARPQWIGDPVSLPTTGRDVMLAVDLSGSMGTEDMELDGQTVNRLAVVKDVVGTFIERRSGDRVGLILFGTNAYLQAPLTFDLNTASRLLVEAPIGIAGGRTAIGDAIGLAVKHLRQRPAEQRILILLTDGASNSGSVTPEDAAGLAKASAIRIYTVGVGSDAMPMPGLLGALTRGLINPSSEMDEATLTAIAEQTGGRYFRARATRELVEIYELIDRLEPIAQDPAIYRPTVALFHWPLGLAWCLLGLVVVLRAGRPRHV